MNLEFHGFHSRDQRRSDRNVPIRFVTDASDSRRFFVLPFPRDAAFPRILSIDNYRDRCVMIFHPEMKYAEMA